MLFPALPAEYVLSPLTVFILLLSTQLLPNVEALLGHSESVLLAYFPL